MLDKRQRLGDDLRNYNESSKSELWTWMKQWGNAATILAFVAGCALSPWSYTPSSVSLPGLLFYFAVTVVTGAILGALIFAVITFFCLQAETNLPARTKVIFAVLIPVAVILLKRYFR